MYLFISAGDTQLPKFKKYQTCSDYLYDNNLKKLQKKVIKYLDEWAYSKDEPKGVWKFNKKYGAVVEKYCGDIGGWIIKL